MGVGLSRCFVKVPLLPLQDSGWKGSSSLVGACSHLAFLFDERQDLKNVRAKALRSRAAKAQAVVGAGGCTGGSLDLVLVKRDIYATNTWKRTLVKVVMGSIHSSCF